MYRRRLLLTLPMLLIVAIVSACGDGGGTSAQIVERGELRFITRNSPTTYYLGRSGPRGFEYDLAARFARELGVELVVTQAFSLEELFRALDRDEADIAGAGLTLTEERADRYASSLGYARQRPEVIYKVGRRRPRTVDQLEGLSIAVLADSSHEELLESYRKDGRDWLSWDSVKVSDSAELLQRVNDDRNDIAIVDSRDFFIQQSLLPRLETAFELAGEQDIVWYLPRAARKSPLLGTVNAFLAQANENGSLAELHKRYFDRDKDISRIDSHTFVTRVRKELSNYQQLIEIVAREQQMPWELLAAISYQESHWDPEATSRTGVRGMMMLTLPTAEELGVENRTDPAESLRGGARYFKNLRRRLPDDIFEPDRSWLALAAYNIGMGHLEDARVLTERRGGDPHLWKDIMDTLPLLEEPEHYQTLRYGYARGLEAVRYVQNIRHYYNILRWQTAHSDRPRPPEDVDPLVPVVLRDLKLRAL